MPSAARKPTTTDDKPDSLALAVPPKPRQRHDPKVKAQAELDRAQVQINALSAEIGKHGAAIDSANNRLKLALRHRDYLAKHPLLVAPEGTAQNPLPEPDDEGDDPSWSRR